MLAIFQNHQTPRSLFFYMSWVFRISEKNINFLGDSSRNIEAVFIKESKTNFLSGSGNFSKSQGGIFLNIHNLINYLCAWYFIWIPHTLFTVGYKLGRRPLPKSVKL